MIWFNLALVFPTVSLGFYHARMVDVMTPFLAALLGLGVNEGSSMTEIVRGGILSVEQGQLDAASSLGMNRLLAMRRIVIPQAMRVIVPSFGNEFIGMLKTSAMASAIAYTEMLNQAQIIYFINDKIMELLLVAAGWYLIVVTLFSGVQDLHRAAVRPGPEPRAPALPAGAPVVQPVRRAQSGRGGGAAMSAPGRPMVGSRTCTRRSAGTRCSRASTWRSPRAR